MSRHLAIALLLLTACPPPSMPDGGTGGGATAGGSGGSTGGGGGTAGGTGGGTGGATGGGTGGGATGGGSGGGGPVDAGFCGDSIRGGNELCDDGNMSPTDGCKNDCTFSAPGDFCGNGAMNGAEACDDGNVISGDGCEADCTISVAAPSGTTCGDTVRQGSEECDDGNVTPADGCEPDCTLSAPTVISCPAANQPINNTTSCDVVPGDANKLLVGTLLLPGKILKGGQVLVNGTSGNIACVGCDCSGDSAFAGATKLLCGQNVISPGLINSHDHITFTAAPYVANGVGSNGLLADGGVPERYEHRHDWRKGGAAHAGHTAVSSGSTSGTTITFSELRQVMAGTTSVAGSGGAAGLLRNLDKAEPLMGGLGAGGFALYDTFPLKDSAGTELTESCSYPTVPSSGIVPANASYLPHVSEGIERSARNEFICLSGALDGGAGIFGPRTAFIHGIALKPADVRLTAAKQASLIWSPRSNVSLYGETAQVTVYNRARSNIALGSDWVRSGSMNIVRELQCADYLSTNFYGDYFSDESLWRMVTSNAAKALSVSTRAGTLAQGFAGDVAVYRYYSGNPYRAVITANPQDVLLTMRASKVLYGDDALSSAMGTGCDAITVCGTAKRACVSTEINITLSALQAANPNTYPLFFCNGPPPTEPVCTPMRSAQWLFSSANAYSGVLNPPTDTDGDGIPDSTDNCPKHFNPLRPEDNGVQADADGDGKGDVCDVCPLAANTTSCGAYDPADFDGDGVANASDNCKLDPNASQTDQDSDGKGDACDECPTRPNPGSLICPPPPGMLATIYEIKSGTIVSGTRVQLVGALVTGVGANGMFVQVHELDTGYTGPNNSGLFIYYPGTLPRTDVQIGDRITIPSAFVQLYSGGAATYSQIELANVPAGSVQVLTRINAMPAATIATPDEVRTGGTRSVALEGVIVRVNNVTAGAAPAADMSDQPPINEFTVTDGNGMPLRVNDYLFLVTPAPQAGEAFGFIQGILEVRNNDWKLEPRFDADMQRQVGLLSLGPSGQFTREGQTDAGATFPLAVTVQINSAQSTDTVVTLASDAGIFVPPTVTVLAGTTSAVVPVQGLVQSPAEFITATLDGGSFLSVNVRVVGLAEVPQVVSLTPSPLLLPEDGTADLTVTLDIPPAVPTDVTIDADAGFALVPPFVTVAPDTRTAVVHVLAAPNALGPGTITASLPAGSSATANVTISNLPTTDHVVISEVQIGSSASGNDEFVELYNPTAAAVDISGWRIQYRSATGTSYSNDGQLPPGSVIASHGYFLIVSGGTGGYSGSVAGDNVRTSNAGNPTALGFAGVGGHVRIGLSGVGSTLTDPSVVDMVGYGTAIGGEGGAAAPVPAASGTIERKANVNATSATMAAGGADALFGNGQDLDNSGADWVTRAAPQPQNKASATEP